IALTIFEPWTTAVEARFEQYFHFLRALHLRVDLRKFARGELTPACRRRRLARESRQEGSRFANREAGVECEADDGDAGENAIVVAPLLRLSRRRGQQAGFLVVTQRRRC